MNKMGQLKSVIRLKEVLYNILIGLAILLKIV
jgi:hypothetical protein